MSDPTEASHPDVRDQIEGLSPMTGLLLDVATCNDRNTSGIPSVELGLELLQEALLKIVLLKVLHQLNSSFTLWVVVKVLLIPLLKLLKLDIFNAN